MIKQALEKAAKEISQKKLKSLARKYISENHNIISVSDVQSIVRAIKLLKTYKKSLR